MKNTIFNVKTIIVFLNLIGVLSIFSCMTEDDKNAMSSNKTYQGKDVFFAGGNARTYVTMDEKGMPTKLGISIDKMAIDNLTMDKSGFQDHDIVLPLPSEAAMAGFDHVFFNMNTSGPEQVGISPKSHFDFHFSYLSYMERMKIPPFDVDNTMFDNLPMAEYFPANYKRMPGGMASVGVNWMDATENELFENSLQHTLLMGSYNGMVTHVTPMISLDALMMAKAPKIVPIKQPTMFNHGYFPMDFSYVYDSTAGEYRIELTNLISK